MEAAQKHHSVVLLTVLAVTCLCNFFDLGFTLYALEHIPHAFEINPFFRLMLKAPVVLYFYKFVLLPVALWVMYRARKLKLARFGLWLCFTVFVVNTIYQIWSIRLW